MSPAQELADLATAALPVRLDPAPGYFLLALWPSRDRIVSYDLIAERIWDMTAQRPTAGAVATSAKRLRKVIAATGWPIAIETHTGLGYRLVVLAPGWSWAPANERKSR